MLFDIYLSYLNLCHYHSDIIRYFQQILNTVIPLITKIKRSINNFNNIESIDSEFIFPNIYILTLSHIYV